MPPNSRVPGCFLLVWLLLWTVAVLVGDGYLCRTFSRQLRATTFPRTDGVITRSEIKTADDADGPSHRLNIAYNYTVGGQRYTGTRYSYSEMGVNTTAWHKIRDGLPVGSRVPVAYNPNDPAESMLRPGLTGFHLMLVWFLTPFNLIMIGGWAYYVRGRRPAFGPHSVTRTATGWRVRVPGLGRAGTFGAVLLGVTFVGIFVWGIGCGFNPPLEFAGPGYVAVVAFAALVARRAWPWFEVDETARVLRFPAELPFAAVREVIVTHEEKRDPDEVTHRYHCDLVRADAPVVRTATYSEPAPAESLAAWLRERIDLTPAST